MAAERTRHRIVLVVDDDPDILQTLALCLSTEGYGVLMASNGQEALEVLRQQKPACILLDLMMPVMDGWEFRRQQKADPELAPVPVIVLSALDQGRAAPVDADAFLKKPLDFDRLLGLVRDHCR